MRYVLALAACCALVSVPFALASEGDATQPQATVSSPCTPLKTIYSEHRWREAHPMRGQTPCLSGRRRNDAGPRATKEHFFLYQRYREATPYRCQSGSRGTWAIPCSIISCESGFSWEAYNPSGASGPYQLLGWGAPYPARSFREKVENHLIAARVYAGGSGRSNWVC